MTSLCCGALALLAAAPAASQAATSRLGTPEVVAAFDGEAYLRGAADADGFAVFNSRIGRNDYPVVFRDRAGKVHRFTIPTTQGTFPEGIRIVPLEDGGAMALWDEGRTTRVLARAWTADGTLGPTVVALADVTTVHSADNDSAQWRVRADGRGTVVVASTGPYATAPASVVAAVREPGSATFGPRQVLTPPSETTGVLQRDLTISAIAADGSVGIAWGPEYGDGDGGRAARTGRAAFGAPEAIRYVVPDPGLRPGKRVGIDELGRPFTVSAQVAALCPCARVKLLRWPDGTARLVLQRAPGGYPFFPAESYVATPDARGTFGRPVLATRLTSVTPVRRERPGEVGFAYFDTNTDYNRFKDRSRLVIAPFGPAVPRSRRAARVEVGTFAPASRTRVLVPVSCDRVCGIHGSSGRQGRLRVVTSEGKARDARLEPFDVGYLRVPLAKGRTRVTVRVLALDDAGHRTVRRATFVRGKRPTSWCPAGRGSC